jgi:biotin carboxyl carrier protein
VVAGTATTATIDDDWRAEEPKVPEDAWSEAAGALRSRLPGGGRHGFRLNAPPQVRVRIDQVERTVPAALGGHSSKWMSIDGDDRTPAATLDLDGLAVRATIAPPPDVDTAVSHAARIAEGVEAVVAPMPGTIIAVRVAEGDRVEAHQVLVLLEAMKMENAVTAPADATVTRVLVAAGQTVQRGERLVELA